MYGSGCTKQSSKNILVDAGMEAQNSFCNVLVINDRGCSIVTSRIGGGWVSTFFVMLRGGKRGGEWYQRSN